MNTVTKWQTAEYLEGIRFAASTHNTLGAALDRAQRSARIGIDCEVIEYALTVEPNASRVVPMSARIVATVGAYTFGPIAVNA